MTKNVLSLFVAFVFVATNLNAQDLKFGELEGLKKGKYESYQCSDGSVYKIGDRLKIGMPASGKYFTYIYVGDGILTDKKYQNASISNRETEIKNIYLVKNKRSGNYVIFRTRAAQAFETQYTIEIENAIASKEIKSFGMTPDEALEELKKAKDKLDLGLINQEKYDELKKELSKHIK